MTIKPDPSFALEIQAELGEKLLSCYQCKKCSGGCPLSFAMDLKVHEVIRLLQLGAAEALAGSSSYWLCSGCKTCKQRCPSDIDGSRVMDYLKLWSFRSKRVPSVRTVPALNASFLSTVKRYGRVYDLGMMASYKSKTGTFTQDLGLGFELFKRGKLKLMPHRIKRAEQIRAIFRKAGEEK